MTVIGDAEDVVVAFLKYCQRLRWLNKTTKILSVETGTPG
jgi:hypothetical protein